MEKRQFTKLTELIAQFPGIGERQAYRIAQYIVRKNKQDIFHLSDTIKDVRNTAQHCPSCNIYHEGATATCSICEGTQRDATKIVVVEKDIDVSAIEKSGVYNGTYFVFGRLIPIKSPQYLEKSSLHKLTETIQSKPVSSVTLAFSIHPDANHTTEIIADALKTLKEKETLSFEILTPGRGLSSGLELEYADPETIQHAFKYSVRI